MTKLFLIQRQADYTTFWKQVCPNCTSIEELSETITYDTALNDRGYKDETIYGYDFSNPRNHKKDNICKNCGHVFVEVQ